MPVLPKASRPNEILKTLIEAANALRPDVERWRKPLPALSGGEAWPLNIQIDARQRRLAELAQFRKHVKKTPKVVRDYIGPINADTCQDAIDRYNEIIAAREILRGFSDMNSSPERAKLDFRLGKRSAGLVRSEFAEINKQGLKPQLILKFHLSPIVEALDGKDVFRIRICKTCEKLFWAYRYNADYCTKTCGNVMRNRRYRKRVNT